MHFFLSNKYSQNLRVHKKMFCSKSGLGVAVGTGGLGHLAGAESPGEGHLQVLEDSDTSH